MILETLWQYVLLFVMAATPWLEILIVIPIGVAIGLHPVMVAIVSFLGNFLPIIVIVYSFKWFQQTSWNKRRQARKLKKAKEKRRKKLEDSINKNDSSDQAPEVEENLKSEPHMEEHGKAKPTKKERAARIFHKYGLPGLAFLGPLVTGIHLAAILALSLKADKNRTTIWMGISLFAWTVILTVATVYSIDWLSHWF